MTIISNIHRRKTMNDGDRVFNLIRYFLIFLLVVILAIVGVVGFFAFDFLSSVILVTG